MLHKLLLSLLFSLSLFALPAAAQVNLDIPETQTSDGGPGGGTPGDVDRYCADCCSGDTRDPGCCDACSCQCGLLGCNTYSYMKTAGVPLNASVAVRRSVNEAISRMEQTARGKALSAVLTGQIDRLTAIYEKSPELQGRTARAMVAFWPWDMWTNQGKDAHQVSREALTELRGILTAVAETDAAMGGSEIGATIEKSVLPHLTRDLVGRPYHEAFACFIGAEGCR